MEATPYHIQNFIHIKNQSIFVEGELVFQTEDNDFSTFIKSAYRHFKMEYPKFFKMDNLSKLAFMASDLILKKEKPTQSTALVFSNKASSLDTDRKHQASIEDEDNYFPSPAIFVYTLSNICLGEISIKHGLHSENSFFIFNHFNASHLFHYSNALLNTKKTEKVLCGWVEFDANKYEAFVYLVSKNGNRPHNLKEIENLYNTP